MNSISKLPLISVVIPNHNGSRYLENCLRSLQDQSYGNMEIVVVDNASQDQSVRIARANAPGVIVVQERQNLGFAGGANAGIRSSRGEWVAILNNDTEVASDWLAECVRAIQCHPDAAFFASKIMDFSDRDVLYSAGDCYLRAGIGYRRGQEQKDSDHFRKECEIFSASGCAALYRKSLLEEMGGFDEHFFAYLEDVDLGLRIQAAGYRGYYLPRAEVYHYGAATSGGEFSPLSVRLRTRNSLLLLFKCLPGRILLRCLPMIFVAQFWWFVRAVAHLRLVSYAQGLCGAFLLAPAMVRKRTGMRPYWRRSNQRFWRCILQSESLAGDDFAFSPEKPVSRFLKWYFRLF